MLAHMRSGEIARGTAGIRDESFDEPWNYDHCLPSMFTMLDLTNLPQAFESCDWRMASKKGTQGSPAALSNARHSFFAHQRQPPNAPPLNGP